MTLEKFERRYDIDIIQAALAIASLAVAWGVYHYPPVAKVVAVVAGIGSIYALVDALRGRA